MRGSSVLSRLTRSIFIPQILALAVALGAPTSTFGLVAAPAYQFIDLGGAVGYGDVAIQAIYGNQCAGYARTTNGSAHAMYWPGGSAAPIDLNPAGYTKSWARGIGPTQQVGEGTPVGGDQHALLWSGSPENVIDLNPVGYASSVACAISGGKQAGIGTPTGVAPSARHALLWSGSAASVVDLHPSNYYASLAYAMAGSQVTGTGGKSYGSYHALLWDTDTGGFADLHPSGWNGESFAVATDGQQQVGRLFHQSRTSAFLWSGTPDSAINLTPADYIYASAEDVYGGLQVGCGAQATGGYRALLWSGSADSAVDLHQFVPAAYAESYAKAIDASGVIAGYATLNGYFRPVFWVPVPEPMSGILLLGMAGWALVRSGTSMTLEKDVSVRARPLTKGSVAE